MNQPEQRAAEPNATGKEKSENEHVAPFSPFDPEVEAPINAAVHLDADDVEKKASDEYKAPSREERDKRSGEPLRGRAGLSSTRTSRPR
jgi:hypothetical protein